MIGVNRRRVMGGKSGLPLLFSYTHHCNMIIPTAYDGESFTAEFPTGSIEVGETKNFVLKILDLNKVTSIPREYNSVTIPITRTAMNSFTLGSGASSSSGTYDIGSWYLEDTSMIAVKLIDKENLEEGNYILEVIDNVNMIDSYGSVGLHGRSNYVAYADVFCPVDTIRYFGHVDASFVVEFKITDATTGAHEVVNLISMSGHTYNGGTVAETFNVTNDVNYTFGRTKAGTPGFWSGLVDGIYFVSTMHNGCKINLYKN